MCCRSRCPLFLSAALAPHSQLRTGVTVSFPSLVVAVCGLLKPLIFHFPGSREARAPSWHPKVGVHFPARNPLPACGPKEASLAPPRPQSAKCAKSPYRALLSDPRNVKATGPPRGQMPPGEAGPLA